MFINQNTTLFTLVLAAATCLSDVGGSAFAAGRSQQEPRILWRKYDVTQQDATAEKAIFKKAEDRLEQCRKKKLVPLDRKTRSRSDIGELQAEVGDADYLKGMWDCFAILDEEPGPSQFEWKAVRNKTYFTLRSDAMKVLLAKSYDISQAGIHSIRQELADEFTRELMAFGQHVEPGANGPSPSELQFEQIYTYFLFVVKSWPVSAERGSSVPSYQEAAIEGLKGLHEVWDVFKHPSHLPNPNSVHKVIARQEKLYNVLDRSYENEIRNVTDSDLLMRKLVGQKREAVEAFEILRDVLLGTPEDDAGYAIAYEEDFTTNPLFTASNEVRPQDGDQLLWQEGSYRVFLKEYGPGAHKFAVTPTFESVANASFELTFDLQYTHSSYGMGMTILCVDHDINRYANGPVDYALAVGMYTHHSGAQNKRGTFIVGDHLEHASQRSRRSDNSTWYRIHLVYDKASGLGDLVIVDRERQSIFHEDHGFALSPGAFNRIAFGATCRYNDGTSAEMRLDNVRVRVRH